MKRKLSGLSVRPIPAMTDRQIEVFWSHYSFRDMPDACWIPDFTRTKNGYAHVTLKKSPYRAHRVAWVLTNGETDQCVLHSCDNRLCGNPKHLHLGDRKKNWHECMARERWPRKANATQVKEIRERWANRRNVKITQEQLGNEYGMSQTGIWHILTRKDIDWNLSL